MRFLTTDYGRTVLVGRYTNANGYAAAIVAVISVPEEPLHDNTPGWRGDWAAYWGGCNVDMSQENAGLWVARYGNKMSEEDARHFFFREGSWEQARFGPLPYRR